MRRSWTLSAAVLALLVLTSGCATEDIVVSEVAMTDRADASVVGWTASESGRYVFSPEDEEVIVKVLFNFNYRGVYEWYKVEWIAPGGDAYQVVALRTDFASHRDLQASLKIRGKMASRLPGVWRVKVSLLGREGAPDRLLVSRLFRIAEPSAEMLAAGLTPVDAPRENAGRPLASFSRRSTAAPTPTPVAAAQPAPVSAVAVAAQQTPPGADIAQDTPAVAPSGASQKTAGSAIASTPAEPAPKPPASAAVPGLLPPLAIIGSGAPPPPITGQTAPATNTASRRAAPTAGASASTPPAAPPFTASTQSVAPAAAVESLPAESGISSVSLQSVPAAPGKINLPVQRRVWPGCPPLYYPPGPGCVEQAPQE